MLLAEMEEPAASKPAKRIESALVISMGLAAIDLGRTRHDVGVGGAKVFIKVVSLGKQLQRLQEAFGDFLLV